MIVLVKYENYNLQGVLNYWPRVIELMGMSFSSKLQNGWLWMINRSLGLVKYFCLPPRHEKYHLVETWNNKKDVGNSFISVWCLILGFCYIYILNVFLTSAISRKCMYFQLWWIYYTAFNYIQIKPGSSLFIKLNKKYLVISI